MKKNLRLLVLYTFLLVTISLGVCGDGDNDSHSSSPDLTSDSREVTSVNSDWTFQMDYDLESNPETVDNDFDDSSWQSVSIPHNWMVEEGQSGGEYFHGPSVYRKTIIFANIEDRRRYYLQFEGVSLHATVYLNGMKLGEHQGGFSTFRFDMTDDLVAGENILVVEVDNTLSEQDQRNPYLPIDNGADFNWWGGIYRDVSVVEVADIAIDMEDFGGPGVYLSQRDVSANSADVDVAVHLRNKSQSYFSGEVQLAIMDANDEVVQTLIIPSEIPANNVTVLTKKIVLDAPHLWNGLKDPYLYTLETQLVSNGNIIDQVNQPFGLRSFQFDPVVGFVLNGEAYPLRGIAMHQDYIDMGWATTWEQRKESIDIVHEMGANTIRFAHYPHNQDTRTYSDVVGFVNWSEIPMINSISLEESFKESATQQLTEMIKQSYNNPSVAVWGITNEIITQNPYTFEETAEFVKDLSDYVHEIDGDAYRKTIQAAKLDDPIDSPLHLAVDVNSHNRYDGWYQGSTSDIGKFLDDFSAEYPDRAVGLSEYGVGASAYWHTDSPERQDHSEQYSQYFHEQYLKQIIERPYLWGTHVWNMFDFAVDTRNEGDTKGRNDKGLVSYDRQIKKDAFYLYQAALSVEPMVHIASKRQMESCPAGMGLNRPSNICGPEGSARTYIKVYSNLDELTVYVDGVAQSSKLSSDNDLLDFIYEWDQDEIALLAGNEYEIEVRGTNNGQLFSDSYDYIRVPSDRNILTSTEIAVLNGDDETVGTISQLPYEMTLSQLLDSLTIPPGVDIYFNEATIESIGGATIVQAGDDLKVTSEMGSSRIYTVANASNLAFSRPVTDNGLKGTFVDYDNTQHLTDGDYQTLWTARSADHFSEGQIDLQHVFYIDSVRLIQGAASAIDGGMTAEIGTNIVEVDHVVHTDPIPIRDNVTIWQIGAVGKNVRAHLTDYNKLVGVTPRGNVYGPLIGQIEVYGGLVYSDTLPINYETRTITASGMTVAELRNALNVLSSQFGEFAVDVLDGTGAAGTDADTLTNAYTVEALRYVGDLTYREVYSIQ